MLRAVRSVVASVVICVASSIFATSAVGAPPWATLVPFKKIEADPNKYYELDEKQGPWMIMAASFAGPSAEQQSHDLVIELRQKYKLEAYAFRRTYDFSKPTDGLGYNRYGGPRRMRHLSNYKFDEIAVLVGNFSSIQDPQIDRALGVIKHVKPDALDPNKKPDSSQRLLGARTLYSMMSSSPEKREKGPMGAAFVTKNPLLPEEFFVAKGLDPFVYDMNKDLPHSVLKCPGKYTVRIASFRGVDSMKPTDFDRLTTMRRDMAKIDKAALNASKLCAALRDKGVEAYEFHDRTESFVTIGSFNEVGQPRPDGKIEINPAVLRVMEEYKAKEVPKPGTIEVELYARVISGIRIDPQPIPVEVPRQSIAANYNATNSLLQ